MLFHLLIVARRKLLTQIWSGSINQGLSEGFWDLRPLTRQAATSIPSFDPNCCRNTAVDQYHRGDEGPEMMNLARGTSRQDGVVLHAERVPALTKYLDDLAPKPAAYYRNQSSARAFFCGTDAICRVLPGSFVRVFCRVFRAYPTSTRLLPKHFRCDLSGLSGF